MTSQKTIIYIDASCITQSDCLRRLSYIHSGLTTKPKIDLVFGIAFHKFAEKLDKTYGDLVSSIAEAQEFFKEKSKLCKVSERKDFLNISYLTSTCVRYAERFKEDSFKTLTTEKGTTLAEVKFCFPFLETSDKIYMLCGTIDRIGRVGQNGVYAIMDYKTTSCWNSDEYLEGYRLSPQLLIYALAVQHYASSAEDTFFKKLSPLRVCIEGIFLKKDKEAEFKRSEFFSFSSELLKEFKNILAERIVRYDNYLTYTPTHRDGILTKACDTKYGKCAYLPLCLSPNPSATEALMLSLYDKRTFNPLKYNE